MTERNPVQSNLDSLIDGAKSELIRVMEVGTREGFGEYEVVVATSHAGIEVVLTMHLEFKAANPKHSALRVQPKDKPS